MIAKRIFDLVLAILSILILSPLIVLLTLVLSITTCGKPFFSQKRVGRHGKIFCIYKFRTLKPGAPAYTDITNIDLCQYETRIGKLMRKMGIDEIPQLINILKGDMSFVGPRPLILNDRVNLMRRMGGVDTMRPGLTGMAQIHGGNMLNEYLKFMYDAYYVRHWSIKLDLKILWQTIFWIKTKAKKHI